MSSLNQVSLIGRLGKDPEVRHTQGGKPIANFSVATSETWKDKSGEKQERTEWHNVVVFNEGLANVVEKYLHKGSQVYVQGQIRTRKWEDKDGATRYTTEVVLDAFNGVLRMLGGKPEGGASESEPKPQAKAKPAVRAEELLDDEVPF
jgi:single-strand DNA-binding protein